MPRFKPSHDKRSPTGQIHIDIGMELKQRINQAATDSRVGIKEFIIQALEFALDNLDD